MVSGEVSFPDLKTELARKKGTRPLIIESDPQPAVPDVSQERLPLATFASYAFNEERHIAAAIESAF